jgi:hypothetical protein
MSKIDDKNRIEEQFIFSQAFHGTPGGHVRETTTREQFEPRILESFDTVTQELHQQLPAMIHKNSDNTNTEKNEVENEQKTGATPATEPKKASCLRMSQRPGYVRYVRSRPRHWWAHSAQSRRSREQGRAGRRTSSRWKPLARALCRLGISGARKSELRNSAANQIARPVEIRGAVN